MGIPWNGAFRKVMVPQIIQSSYVVMDDHDSYDSVLKANCDLRISHFTKPPKTNGISSKDRWGSSQPRLPEGTLLKSVCFKKEKDWFGRFLQTNSIHLRWDLKFELLACWWTGGRPKASLSVFSFDFQRAATTTLGLLVSIMEYMECSAASCNMWPFWSTCLETLTLPSL